jgi:monodictyphenone polyketide synthase
MASIGAEVIRQAFRLGVLVHQVSQNLQHDDIHDDAPLDSWAYVVPNVAAQQVQQYLNAMHKKEVSQTNPDPMLWQNLWPESPL